MLYEKSNKELLLEYNQKVLGHIEAKKVLIAAINRQRLRHKQRWIDGTKKDDLLKNSKILLVGDSGTGKTFLVETLSEILDFPFIVLDATHLGPSSGHGISPEDLYKQVKRDVIAWVELRGKKGYTHSWDGALDQAVVFIDEIDKLAKNFDSTGNWNNHVQSNFLTVIDDKEIFGGVTWILAGAFVGLEEQTNNKNSIGFHSSKKEEKNGHLDEAIVKYGLLPELVGRLNKIVKLDKFTKLELKAIFIDMLLPQKQHELIHFNASYLDISKEQIDDIIARALVSNQGVRFMQRELDKLCLDIEFDYEEYPPDRLLLDNYQEAWGDL